MIPIILLQLVFAFQAVNAEPPFNNPPGVDVWCGKAYRATNSSFDPGGGLHAPNATSTKPLLDVRFYPRKSIYLSGEKTGSFIVDAPISYVYGDSYSNSTFVPGQSGSQPFNALNITIKNANTGEDLVPWREIGINSTGNEFEFPLSSFSPQEIPYPVHLFAVSPDAIQSYQTNSLIHVLPPRNSTGSVSRIDQLYGGLEITSSLTNNAWKSIFPYSFYTSWTWISSTINNASATKNLTTFRNNGYNIIHIDPPIGPDPFNHTVFEEFMKICDSLELYVQIDYRHMYQNHTAVQNLQTLYQTHPSFLLHYAADEPDGWTDPLNATLLTYNAIQSFDPYHPVSLVLNCQNFYFGEYTSGTDIVMEDVYPIAINPTFSPVYNTTCNATYGDCGCDNCHAYDPAYPLHAQNPFLDITNRLDDFVQYQEWLGLSKQAGMGKGAKPLWGVPQGFWDNGSFWGRYPSAQEEAVMATVSLNHGAKGIVAWAYPTNDELEKVTGALAQVLTSPGVVGFTLGAKRTTLVQDPAKIVDVTGWGREGEMLVSYVYQGYKAASDPLPAVLPEGSQDLKVKSVLWGREGWAVKDGKLTRDALEPLEIGIMLLTK